LFASGSKNVGQKIANGKFIMFIDDDNVVDKKMIEELVGFMNVNVNAGEAGPVNYNLSNNKILFIKSSRNMWTTKTFHLRSLISFKTEDYWETADIPNAFIVRNEIVKNKIEFNPMFGIMYEESDYAYRIKKRGYKIYIVNKAKIFHDIDNHSSKEAKKDYLYHFMEDERRPFVFARNRIIFHYLYSTKIQFLFICLFWIWFFVIYYLYKFIFYKGYGEFSFKNKIVAALSYLNGTMSGFKFVLNQTKNF
jgi:GT2 family glycosyltransferase